MDNGRAFIAAKAMSSVKSNAQHFTNEIAHPLSIKYIPKVIKVEAFFVNGHALNEWS